MSQAEGGKVMDEKQLWIKMSASLFNQVREAAAIRQVSMNEFCRQAISIGIVACHAEKNITKRYEGEPE